MTLIDQDGNFCGSKGSFVFNSRIAESMQPNSRLSKATCFTSDVSIVGRDDFYPVLMRRLLIERFKSSASVLIVNSHFT